MSLTVKSIPGMNKLDIHSFVSIPNFPLIEPNKISPEKLKEGFIQMKKNVGDLGKYIKILYQRLKPNVSNKYSHKNNLLYVKFYDLLNKLKEGMIKIYNQENISKHILENMNESINSEIKKLQFQLFNDLNIDFAKNKIDLDNLAEKIIKDHIETIYYNLSHCSHEIEVKLINCFMSLMIGEIEISPDLIEVYLRSHQNLIFMMKKFPIYSLNNTIIDFVVQNLNLVSPKFKNINKIKDSNLIYLIPLYEWISSAINYSKIVIRSNMQKAKNEMILNEIEELQSKLELLSSFKLTKVNENHNYPFINDIIIKEFACVQTNDDNFQYSLCFFDSLKSSINKIDSDIQDLYFLYDKDQKNILTTSIITKDISTRCRSNYCSMYSCFVNW